MGFKLLFGVPIIGVFGYFFAGYLNREETGVTAYGGRLNVRPAYQREFVYSDKEQKAVIDSALNGFPLNTFYWAANPDGSYELLDGQQRTMSILEFLSNKFMVDCLGTSYGAGNLPSGEVRGAHGLSD